MNFIEQRNYHNLRVNARKAKILIVILIKLTQMHSTPAYDDELIECVAVAVAVALI